VVVLAMYIIADVILLAFFIIEIFARDSKEARKVTKTEFEKGSTDFAGLVIVISSLTIIIAPLLDYFNLSPFTFAFPIVIIGPILAIIGIIVRTFGMLTLGRFYTRTLQKAENHILVTDGIYKYLRHPGYAGTIFIFLGASLTTGNMILFVLVTLLILLTYLYRIHVEEKMLVLIFGEQYIIYKKHSKKIIPFIY